MEKPYRDGVNVQKVSTKNGYNWHPIEAFDDKAYEKQITMASYDR